MSSDDTPSTRFGPAVRTNQVLRPNSVGRQSFGGSPSYRGVREGRYTQQYDGQRNLFEVLGYTQSPEYEHFEARYQRNGTAAALVDKPPQDCWDEPPDIIDTGTEDSDEQSDFEQAVESFLKGGGRPWEQVADIDGGAATTITGEQAEPISVFERVDRMARLGRFGLLFIGFADDAVSESSDGEAALSEPVDVSSLDGEDGIAYLSAYDEGRVDWTRIQAEHLDENPVSPRYGRPEHYLVELQEDADTVQIHHSRVIHVVEDPFDQDLLSDSVLRKSLNRLDDRAKVFGASAEAFWRAAYQGLVVKPPDNTAAGQAGGFTDEGEGVHKQIAEYVHNLDRAIFSNGDIETLGADIASPADHIDVYDREIASGHDIPQSILMGNETGERATAEDRQMYHEFLGQRLRQHCENQILRPFINRGIAFNVFPEPVGDSYRFDWPPRGEPSEQEIAETRQANAAAIKAASGGTPSRLFTDAEIRTKFFDMGGARGSDDPDDLDSDAEAATAADLEDRLDVDEADAAVQEQFAQGQGQGQGQPGGGAAGE